MAQIVTRSMKKDNSKHGQNDWENKHLHSVVSQLAMCDPQSKRYKRYIPCFWLPVKVQYAGILMIETKA